MLTVNVLIQQWDRCPGFFHPVPFISKAIWICKEHQTEAVLVCPGGRDPRWWPQLSVLRKQDPFSSCSQQPDNAGTPGSVLCHSPLCSHCRLTLQCQAVCQDSDDVFSIITSGNGLYGCFCNGWHRFFSTSVNWDIRSFQQFYFNS